jgi:hypothetical protein
VTGLRETSLRAAADFGSDARGSGRPTCGSREEQVPAYEVKFAALAAAVAAAVSLWSGLLSA